MCIVCVEMAKGKLNFAEAKRALKEIAMDSEYREHVQEVTELIRQAEQKELASKK